VIICKQTAFVKTYRNCGIKAAWK